MIVPHFVDVVGRARLDGRRQAAECRDVVVELPVGFFGDLRIASFSGRPDIPRAARALILSSTSVMLRT